MTNMFQLLSYHLEICNIPQILQASLIDDHWTKRLSVNKQRLVSDTNVACGTSLCSFKGKKGHLIS